MPRPRKKRRCRAYDGNRVFKPRAIPMSRLETVRLEISELEAIRLCDPIQLAIGLVAGGTLIAPGW